MKAAILVEQKKPLVIADIEHGELGYGQVLVKVICSGLCGSQLGEIDGVKGVDKFLPHLLGHEGGGIVIETGPGVTRVKKANRVVLHWRKGLGIESPTPRYDWQGKLVGAGWVTTFNEYAVVSENRLTPIPQDVDFEIAALLGCALTTGFGVVNNNAQLKLGESIVIFGSGGVGLSIVQGASLVSAYPIIAVDIHEHKLQLAKKFGATHTINAKTNNVKKEIFGIVGEKGTDVSVETTGCVEVIEQAYEVTASTGKTILVGVPPVNKKISIYSLPLHFDKVLTGSYGGEVNPSQDIPRYINLYRLKRFNPKAMISHYFYLDEINIAIAAMRKGELVRGIIKLEK
jgi:S-(hydroxymethyl)glutathione dehydrogenase/alcohol dehydrogenase